MDRTRINILRETGHFRDEILHYRKYYEPFRTFLQEVEDAYSVLSYLCQSDAARGSELVERIANHLKCVLNDHGIHETEPQPGTVSRE